MTSTPAPSVAPAEAEIDALIAAQLHLEGPLLPIFHALQEAYGHVPQAALSRIAEALNLTRAEVHGVMSFYHDFRSAPAGRHVLKICRAEACQSMGGAALADRLLAKLGLGWHGTTPDGKVTVEPVYCLGLCACAPAAMVDGKVRGRLDEAACDALIAEVRA
ncbi:formate dehydrogenase subunit gamma [Pseudooceanicola nanhaiensis]|uniref:formate dehydrogenase subunit gamma n=1 Tax=Pseudooceanicola nanhaiensis TaxID=375761 RepID=UPI001CD709C0|nr:formate dehydrogenase subunit gamma [Pseudooceanicola nanhaiensis]MCA0922043.1 formate dehydrogenase subunit gamma [Pseudooceanicola nanhaiensis]